MIGGLGSAVCDVLSEKQPTRVCRLGMNDVSLVSRGNSVRPVGEIRTDGNGIYDKVKAFVQK